MQPNFITRIPDRLEPERNLVSVVLDDGRRLLDVIDRVHAEDFSQPALQAAWEWFLILHREGTKITSYTINQRFSTHHHFATFSHLVRELSDGIMPIFVKDYARDVRAHARRVRAQSAVTRLAVTAEAATTVEEIEDGVRDLFELCCSETATKSARKAADIVADIEAALANPTLTPRFPTGFDTLDRMTGGGLKPGQLVIIAARTGGGKTVVAMNIASHVCKAGIPTVTFSLEMSAQDLVMRCIMSEGSAHGEAGAFEVVRGLPLFVDDSSNVTTRSIAAKIKLLASRHQAKVFIVDYLQLLGSDGGSRETRERIVADMSRTLKIAAKENGVVVVALSQVNADGELRESRAIEQDADLVLHIVDVPETEPDPRNRNGPRIETGEYNFFLRVSKQRGGRAHGPISRARVGAPGIPLHFDGPNFKFTEA